MATGDLTITLESNGSYINVTAEGMADAGSYDFGFGANHDPTNATFIVTLDRESYDNTGSLGTTEYTIYGVPDKNVECVRKPYPNQTDPDETISGSDVIIRVKLSEPIYDDDTSITADVESGWYNDGVNDNNALSSYAITNTSTLDYPKVIGNHVRVQGETIIGTTYTVQFPAYQKWGKNGKPVACVKYELSDEHSNTVNGTITEMGVCAESDKYAVLAYIAENVDISSLTDLDKITLKIQAYPWVGDANSVLDTDDAVNSFPTPLYTNLYFRLDKTGQHGFCVVDPTSGNDGSASVYASQAAAESAWGTDPTNAYQTDAAALTAMQSYHNINLGRNDAGGGTFLLTEDTHTINTANGGTMTEWAIFKPVSTASKNNVIVVPAGTGSSMPIMFKVFGCTVSSGTNYWSCTGTRMPYFEECTFQSDGGSFLTVWNFNYGACVRSDGSLQSEFKPFGTYPANWAIIRGNNMATYHESKGWTIVGNHNVRCTERTNTGVPLNDNLVYQGNPTLSNLDKIISLAENYDYTHGIAIICNGFERITSGVNPLVWISGDNSQTTTNHVLLWNNTSAGERWNIGYNDNPGGPWQHTNWSIKNNIISEMYCKQDIFSTDGANVGGWPIRYGEGANGNVTGTCITDVWWINEFPNGLWGKWGSNASPLSLGFIDDQSLDGGNAGNGDYTLTPSSPGYQWLHDLIIPFGINGNAYEVGSDIGAYPAGGATYERTMEDSIILSDSQDSNIEAIGNLSDGFVLSDSESGSIILTVTMIDGIMLSDTDINIVTVNVTISDGIVLSDAVSAIGTFLTTLTDGIILSDSITYVDVTADGAVKIVLTVKMSGISEEIKMSGLLKNIKISSISEEVKTDDD